MGLLREWAVWPFNQSDTSEGWPSSSPAHPYKVRNSHNQRACTLRSLASLLDHTQVPGTLEFPESGASSPDHPPWRGSRAHPQPEGWFRAAAKGCGWLGCPLTCTQGPSTVWCEAWEGKRWGSYYKLWVETICPQVTTFPHRTQSNPSTIDSNFAFQVISESLFSNVELNHSILIVC